MLSLLQLEEYASLLDVIDRYRQTVSQDGLRALSYDKPVGTRYYKPDTIGESVAQQEERRAKLAKLEALEAIQRPKVEKTIKAAAALQTRGAVKIELALRARYLSGRSWPEITALLHVQNPAQITAAALQRLQETEDMP